MSSPPVDSRRRFEAVAAEVYEPLQRYIRRRVAPDAVDDVVAETMLTLWRRLDDIPADAPLPWAYGIARRQLANHRRAAGRHLRLVQRAGRERIPPGDEDQPLDAELAIALDGMPAADREILRLWAWEGLEAAEIAITLSLTANAAAIRLHRAKKKLAEKLEAARKSPHPPGHKQGESRKEERL